MATCYIWIDRETLEPKAGWQTPQMHLFIGDVVEVEWEDGDRPTFYVGGEELGVDQPTQFPHI